MENNNFILITGANGEVGHGLINKLKSLKNEEQKKIIALDLNELDSALKDKVDAFIKGSITDRDLLNKLFNDYKIDTIYHLAAVLSTTGEKKPELAHEVNVGGTFNLLSTANLTAEKDKRVIKMIFPSTIAVYGMPNLQVKKQISRVKEHEYLNPITMYGINKLYCENMGIYFSDHYSQLTTHDKNLDFRCVRFPGLISSDTIPSGGTSDYAPEMLHAAAKKEMYECFVRPDSVIHFMAMPDAIEALLQITNIDNKSLKSRVYNISGFSASAKDIEDIVKKHFPEANISYKIDPARQKIVDSWSESVDDTEAVKDWSWKAVFDFNKAFEEYLIPSIKNKYGR